MSEMTALISLYETLVDMNKLSAPGYSRQKISYAIDLEPDTGAFNGLISMKTEVQGKTRTVLLPQLMDVPTPIEARTGSGYKPRFLWDNPTYLFGITQEGKDPERSAPSFETDKQFHHRMLDNVDSPVARAILNFFDNWDYTSDEIPPALAEQEDDLRSGCNLIFCVGGELAQDDPELKLLWQELYDQDNEEPVLMTSLVSGEEDKIARIHPKIMGVRGGQSTGTSLVSFNFPAACHYGMKQSFNAPMSKYESFAYTSALNYLLSDGKGVYMMDKTTVLCWSEGASDVYQQFVRAVLFDSAKASTLPDGMTEDDVVTTVRTLADGKPCERFGLFPQEKFYLLGIDPNAGRLSVRFFLENSFGSFMRNVSAHYDRMEISRPTGAPPLRSVYMLMRETIRRPAPNEKNPPQINPTTTAQMTNAIINNTRYPASLPTAIISRIRAEQGVSWAKASILKAYYLNSPHPGCPESICTPTLNEDSSYVPYLLGRLFYYYESLQLAIKRYRDGSASGAAKGGKGKKDGEQRKDDISPLRKKYLASAAVTPSHIFGVVLNPLAESHVETLARYNEKLSFWFSKQVNAILDTIGYEVPVRLNNAEQAAFYLGYYHQAKSRFTKKDDEATPDSADAE